MSEAEAKADSTVRLEVPAGAAVLRGVFVSEEHQSAEKGFGLGDVVGVLRETWLYVLLGVGLGGAVGFAVGAVSQPRYKAEAVVMSRSDSQTSAMSRALLSQLGGLASIAGLESSDDTSRQHAVALIKSREFAAQFLRQEGALPVLFPERWDARASAWREDLGEPTVRQAIRRFTKKILRISDDKKTGLLTVAMEMPDRELTAKWANDFVALANESLRVKAKNEAETNLEYLSTALAATPEVSTRQAIYSLIEAQHRSLMLASTTRDFAFRVVDPATAPDPSERVWPPRAALLALGSVAGTIMGLLVGLSVMGYRRRRVRAA